MSRSHAWQQVRQKLVVVNGDLGLPGLGLSPEDRQTLCREVHFVVHSAASISFVDHIHRLVGHNYIVRCAACVPACKPHSRRWWLSVPVLAGLYAPRSCFSLNSGGPSAQACLASYYQPSI